MSNRVEAEADAAIHMPSMPEKTDIQKGSRLTSVGVLGIAAYTQDKWVLLAAVIVTGLIEIARLWSDKDIRVARNARIGLENETAMNAAAHVKAAAIENQ